MEKGIQKDNFTSKYLTFLKRNRQIEEISGGGTPIQTIRFSDTPLVLKNNSPKIIYDKLEENDDELIKPNIKVIPNSIRRVRELGIAIISSKPAKRWKKRQSVEYKIRKIEHVEEKDIVLDYIPKNHKIMWDRANSRVRLIGKNCRNSVGVFGESEWVSIKKEMFQKDYKKTLEESWAEIFNSKRVFLSEKESRFINKIEDIPIIIKEDGIVVCIPHRKEPNNILVVGKKGTGKSLILNRLKSEIFFLWNEKVVIMNDLQDECKLWSEKLDNEKWINQLLNIGERPMGSPIIYIYPNTDTLNLDYNKKEEINFIQTTIPFKEVIKNAGSYLRMNEKGTLRYILGAERKFLECENREEVKKVIENEFPGKTMSGMRNKMHVSFNNVFNEGILNITHPEYPFEISETKSDLTGNPFVILIKIGLIPCFETYDLFHKKYMPEVIHYHLNEIFKEKYPGRILEKETVYILFDELTQICDDSKKNLAYESLCTIGTRGRKMGISLIGATQNYSKIPQKIKSNTDYVFAFKHSNEEEVNLIKKDFDLNALQKEDIMDLNEKDFEVVGITTQYFVCYYKNKKWIAEDKVIRGKLIPPTSNHYHPK